MFGGKNESSSSHKEKARGLLPPEALLKSRAEVKAEASRQGATAGGIVKSRSIAEVKTVGSKQNATAGGLAKKQSGGKSRSK